jgi:hypothetical protein
MGSSREHKNLKNKIRVALNQRGDCWIGANEQGYDEKNRVRFGVGKGGADLLGLVNCESIGRYIELEVKTGNATLQPNQIERQNLVRMYGGYSRVVRSVEDAVEAILDCRRGNYGA